MLELRISELPIHVLNSDHFKMFCELREIIPEFNEDELFYVNEDTYVETLNIKNQHDLDVMIQSDGYFRYCLQDRITIFRNVYNFWLTTEDRVICPNPNMSFLSSQINELLNSKMSDVIMNCMKCNYYELLQYAIEDKFTRKYYYGTYCDLYYAVANNHVECLKIGIKHQFETPELLLEIAAEKGNLEIIKILLDAGCKLSNRLCTFAAKNAEDNIECIKFLHEKGCEWDCRTAVSAAQKGNFKILEYVISNGCDISDKICEYAAIGGNVKCLELAFAHSKNRSAKITYYAAINDNLEAFVYAVEHGTQVSEETLKEVIENRCKNVTPGKVLSYLKNNTL
jgi:hypothetical protein